MNNPTTTEITRRMRERFAEMRRAVDNATAPLVPCQECGRNLPAAELTLSGHCPRCAQLTLTLEDSQ
jgi:Zn finger protein HypA/HybF involved in hydrogenase expression